MPSTRPDQDRLGGPSTPRGGGSAPTRPAPTMGGLWGTRPGRLGVFCVIGAALLGLLITLLAGTEPGVILGVFVVVGTVAGALAVRPGAVYLIIPVPALSYAVAAVIAGLVHDRSVDTSHTALAISAAQWIAGGFVAMTVATAVAVLVAGYRWLRMARLGRGTATGRPEPPR
jgi:hypothetical protein